MAKAKQTKSKAKSKSSKSKAKAKAPPVKAKAKAKPAKAKAKAKPAKAPKAAPAREQVDEFRSYGGKAPSPEERATAVSDSQEAPRFAEVRKLVLDMYRDFYPIDPPETDEKILSTDPNDYDMDPGPFYETLQERFGVASDDNNEYFGGFGGKVETTIAFLTKHWDGKLQQTSEEMSAED